MTALPTTEIGEPREAVRTAIYDREPAHDVLKAFSGRFLEIFNDASYSEIARRLKTNHATIIPWATGKRMPTGELLLRIQNVTGVNLHWLLTGRGPIRGTDTETFHLDEEQRIAKLAAATGRSFEETVRHLAMSALEFKEQV